MRNTDKNRLERHLKAILIISITIVLAILIFLALHGKTTVTGEYPASVKTNSVVCTKSSVSYPYTEGDNLPNPSSRTIRVVGTFNESKLAEKISLDYTVMYTEASTAVDGEAYLHGNFGRKLQEDGLDHAELGNNFSIVDKKVILSLFATVKDINERNYRYLLLPASSNPGSYSITLDEFKNHFAKDKYDCVSTN